MFQQNQKQPTIKSEKLISQKGSYFIQTTFENDVMPVSRQYIERAVEALTKRRDLLDEKISLYLDYLKEIPEEEDKK